MEDDGIRMISKEELHFHNDKNRHTNIEHIMSASKEKGDDGKQRVVLVQISRVDTEGISWNENAMKVSKSGSVSTSGAGEKHKYGEGMAG